MTERSANADLLLLSTSEIANYATVSHRWCFARCSLNLCSDENEQPEGTLASHFTINYMNYPGVTKSDEISALAQALKELPKLTSDVKQKYDQQLKAQFIKEMGLDKDLSPQLYKDLGITTGQLPSWQQLNNYFDQVDKEEKEAVVKIEQEAAKNLT